jgi:ABC-2 type transport system ATP-binding protein
MIEITNLTFGYGKKSLFQNLNLSLKAGHIYGLLGKNGAGKSTLLKNIAGLVFPTAGTCKVNGYTSKNRLPDFLQELFFVPEDIYMPAISARQFADSTGHFYPNFDNMQFSKILAEFDVPDNKPLTQLSFGQQKKVVIAFGISTNTSLLIMDEPTNGLDIPSKAQFRKIIASSLTEDRCVIISTHQVRDLDNLIDSILILHDQKIVVNTGMDQIAEKVNFGIIPADTTDYIYAEPTFSGLQAITLNTDNSYSKVDMEILFNAIITDNELLIKTLNQ